MVFLPHIFYAYATDNKGLARHTILLGRGLACRTPCGFSVLVSDMQDPNKYTQHQRKRLYQSLRQKRRSRRLNCRDQCSSKEVRRRSWAKRFKLVSATHARDVAFSSGSGGNAKVATMTRLPPAPANDFRISAYSIFIQSIRTLPDVNISSLPRFLATLGSCKPRSRPYSTIRALQHQSHACFDMIYRHVHVICTFIPFYIGNYAFLLISDFLPERPGVTDLST